MKILFVTPEFPPKIVGGLGTYSKQIVNGLVNAGHHVTVVTYIGELTKNFEISVEDVSSNLSIYRFSYYAGSDYDYYNSFYWACEEALKKEKFFDIIQLNDYHTFLCGIQFKKKHPDTKVISVFHMTYMLYIIQGCDKFPQYYETLAWKIDQRDKNILNLENEIVKVSHRVITVSNAMKKIIENVYGASSDIVKAVHNGINIQDYQIHPGSDLDELRRSIALPDEKIILFVGRFVEQKGLNIFFEMENTLLNSGINYRMVLVGSGMDISKFTGKSKAPFRITFCGFKKTNEIAAIMRCSDVLVVPSLYEPFGIVAIEGLACRIPVIVSDVDGLSEIIDEGINGFKIPYTIKREILPFDPNEKEVILRVFSGKDFAEKVIQLLNNKELRETITENGFRKVSECFSIDNLVKSTIKVYNGIKMKPRIIASAVSVSLCFIMFLFIFFFRTNGIYKGVIEPFDVYPITAEYGGFISDSNVINGNNITKDDVLVRFDTEILTLEKNILLLEQEKIKNNIKMNNVYIEKILPIKGTLSKYGEQYMHILSQIYKNGNDSVMSFKQKKYELSSRIKEIESKVVDTSYETVEYDRQVSELGKQQQILDHIVKRKSIIAPLSGMIVTRNIKSGIEDDVNFYIRNISKGSYLNNGKPVCYIWEKSKIKVVFKIPEKDSKRIRQNAKIMVLIKSGAVFYKVF